jgi:hypothetical protein
MKLAMSVRLTKSQHQELSSKAASLLYLHQLGLPTPPTIIVPAYQHGDVFSLVDLGQTHIYYVRLCFRKEAHRRDKWKVVRAEEIASELVELASETLIGDLIIQPFLLTSCSGAILKRKSVALVEVAQGLAPTLLRYGRFYYRAIVEDRKTVCSETVEQDMSVIWKETGISPDSATGITINDADALTSRLISFIAPLEHNLLEWGTIGDDIVFFDHKNIPMNSGFFELSEHPPRIPRSITTTVTAIAASSSKSVLRLDYPDLIALPIARRSDFVLVRHGALLSHLSVYSLNENYKCAFQ